MVHVPFCLGAIGVFHSVPAAEAQNVNETTSGAIGVNRKRFGAGVVPKDMHVRNMDGIWIVKLCFLLQHSPFKADGRE